MIGEAIAKDTYQVDQQTTYHSLYVDEWTLLDNVPGTRSVTVTPVETDSAQDLHHLLARTVGKPVVFSVPSENEVVSYVRTVRAEYPEWNLQVVIGTSIPSELPDVPSEPELKYENGKFYVRRIRAIKEPEQVTPLNKGTYIITGGLGFVGQSFANHLKGNQIVLVSSSRDSLPPGTYPVGSRVVKCDVREYAQVKALIQQCSNIKGIIHAAGVLSDKTLPNLTDDDWETVYGPKVRGAQNIDRALKECNVQPDVVLLCSSIASGFGVSGHVAAANGYLDALARSRDNYLSVRWGAWVGGGMARAARGLSVDEALKQFDYARTVGEPVVTIAPLEQSKLLAVPYFDNIRTVSKDDIVKVFKAFPPSKDHCRRVPKCTHLEDRLASLHDIYSRQAFIDSNRRHVPTFLWDDLMKAVALMLSTRYIRQIAS